MRHKKRINYSALNLGKRYRERYFKLATDPEERRKEEEGRIVKQLLSKGIKLKEPLSYVLFLPTNEQVYVKANEEIVVYEEKELQYHYTLRRRSLALVDNTGNTFFEDDGGTKLPSLYERACELAKKLVNKYHVSVGVLNTDKEYESDHFIQKGIKEDRFFISSEHPEETAKTTEHLIKHQKARLQLLIDTANTKRLDRAKENNELLLIKINEIKQEYRETHNGKEAPLLKIAEILNERKIESPRGGDSKWYAAAVKRIIERTSTEHEK